MTIEDRLAAARLPPLPRRAWLEIDEDALRNNVAVIRELVGPHVELSAVVKADAYGHGLVPVARLFESADVNRLCVASLDEAMALRKAGIDAGILVLYPVPSETVDDAERFKIQLTAINEIEVETGLSRGGVKAEQLTTALRGARRSARGLGPHAVWTHLAAPEDATKTTAQIAEFERAIALARAEDEFVGMTRHMAATGGLLTGRAPTYEGVRIGLGLYGLLPLDLPIPDEIRPFSDQLRPAMALKCRPLRVETFPAGTAVGYGGTWIAKRKSVIATLPVGYGDGFARAYSPGTQALVRGRRVPIVGTVAMDAVMADVTDVEGVGPGDEFVLLGRQGDDEITAAELSRHRNTIPWEVVTSMSFRLPRVYHADSVLMGIRTLDGEVRAAEKA